MNFFSTQTKITDLDTGDLLLFAGTNSGLLGLMDKAITYFTKSPYTHVGVVLKDPTFIHSSLKGLYLWESGWENGNPDPQDGKVKIGVQLTPLEEVIKNNKGKYFIRKLICEDDIFNKTFTNDNLEKIHKEVYDKPYDFNPLDWIGALFRLDLSPKKTNR